MHVINEVRTALSVRNFAANTIDTYSRCLDKTQRHFGRALQELTAEDLRGYFEHLTKVVRARARTRNVYLAALKFFYDEMLDRPEVVAKICRAKVGHTIPVVLGGREVSSLLASVSSLKHRAILTSCYASGLRIGEACAIRIEDIDSQRMQLRVPKAKSLARYTILSERLLLLLRAYYRQARPSGPYLFPGGHGRPHMSRETPSKVFRRAAHASGIRKRVTTHTLRHCFATHLLDSGVDIRTVQVLLGHSSVVSTGHYTKLSRAMLRSCKSPLDLLGTPDGDHLG